MSSPEPGGGQAAAERPGRQGRPRIIALDGPAASGKSSIGRLLAERLGYAFLDTGAMYRAVALAALQRGLDLDDQAALGRLAEALQVEVLPRPGADGPAYTTLVEGRDVTWQLRSRRVDAAVSRVAACPAVRRVLTEKQREIARRGRLVMAGRDIGTVVVPHADLKLYLEASPAERARRRHHELLQQGRRVDLQDIMEEMVARDRQDASREASPMQPAADAVLLDTGGLSREEVLQRIMALIGEER